MDYNFKKTIFFISGEAFLGLCVTPSLFGLLAFIALSLFLCIRICFSQLPMDQKIAGGPSRWAVSFIINALIAAFFYSNWTLPSKISLLTALVGSDPKLLLIGCACTGALAAVPFTAALFDHMFGFPDATLHLTRFDKWIKSPKVFLVGIVIAVASVLTMIFFSFSKYIWADESFSLAMIRHSYAEVIQLSAADCAPPLYYLALKVFVDGTQLFFPGIPSVYVAKLFSMIPYIVLLIICIVKVRREWGDYIASMWMACLVSMNDLINYGIEIRMYSWAVFFITLAFLCVDGIVRNKKTAWILFVVSTLSASYTHYFACVAAGILYLALFVWFLLNNKDQLKKWWIAVTAVVFGYLPWLSIFIRQAQVVSKDFWVSDITVGTTLAYIASSFDSMFFMIICVILVILLLKIHRRALIHDWTIFFALGGILLPLSMTFVGIAVSLALRPIFISKYIIPGVACLWLGIIILCDRQEKGCIKILVTSLVILAAVGNISSFIYLGASRRIQSEKTVDFLASNEDAIYICDSGHVWCTLAEISRCPCYFLGDGKDGWQVSLVDENLVYENLGYLHTSEEISALLSAGKNVYFVDSSGTFPEKFIEDDSLGFIEMGSYLVESEVTFYQIIKGERE